MNLNNGNKMKEKLFNARLYLNTDYKLHTKQEDKCAFTCLQYALSNHKTSLLSVSCDHGHNKNCSRCRIFGEAVIEIHEVIRKTPSKEQEVFLQDFEMSTTQVAEWRSHIERTMNQDDERIYILHDLKSNEVLVILDLAVKYLPQIYREKMKYFYGQKGIHWHVCVAVFKDQNESFMVS